MRNLTNATFSPDQKSHLTLFCNFNRSVFRLKLFDCFACEQNSLKAEQMKLQNSVNSKSCLFYYSKIWKKALKRAKTLKISEKNQNLFKSLILVRFKGVYGCAHKTTN